MQNIYKQKGIKDKEPIDIEKLVTEIQKDKNKNCQGSKIPENKMVTHTKIENTNKMIYTS